MAITRALLLLFCSLPAFAQISLSSNALTFTQRQNGPVAYAQTVNISGTGNITLGTCSFVSGPGNMCPDNDGSGLQFDFSNASAAPSVATIYSKGWRSNTLAPGSYVWSQVLTGSSGCSGSCTMTVTLVVVANTPATYSSAGGTQTGCVQASGFDTGDLGVCNPYAGGITPGPSPFTMFGGLGHVVTDPIFSTTYTQIGPDPPNWNTVCADSIVNCTNSDDTLVITFGPGSDAHIRCTPAGVTAGRCATAGTDLWQPSINFNDVYWSNTNPLQMIDLNGLNIRSIVLGGGGSVTYTTIGTAPVGGGNTTITAGNDTRISADNWFAVHGNHDNVTYLVDLNQNPAVFYTSPVWPNSDVVAPYYTACNSGCTFFPRLVMMSAAVNTPNNKRYFAQNFNNSGGPAVAELYSMVPGSGVVVDEGQFGGATVGLGISGYPSTCASNAQLMATNCWGGTVGHLGGFVNVSGVEFYVYAQAYQGNPGYQLWELAMRVDVGSALQAVSAEAGGGTYNLQQLDGSSDNHSSCANAAPVCTQNTDNEVVLTTWDVLSSGGTGTNPETLTLDRPYTGANGDSVLINGAWQAGCGANTGLNGTWTIGNISGSTATINSTGSGTQSTYLCDGTHAAGVMLQNVAPSQSFVSQSEVDTLDLTNLLSKQVRVIRVLKTRTFPMQSQNPNLNNYWGQGHWSLSNDGKYITGNSNNGTPGVLVPFIAASGWTPPAGGKRRIITVH